jgi:alkylhydroperoxidase family enzyme
VEKGLTEEKIARITNWREESVFSERERLALEFADRMALDHKSIGDDFFKRLRGPFSDKEIVELGMMIGQYIGFGRLLMVLDLEKAVCEI